MKAGIIVGLVYVWEENTKLASVLSYEQLGVYFLLLHTCEEVEREYQRYVVD